MRHSLITIALRHEQDVLSARQRARQLAELVGFDSLAQVQIATAVSEVARNALDGGHDAKVELSIEDTAAGRSFLALLSNKGADAGKQPADNPPPGILAAQRLMDDVEIQVEPCEGTIFLLKKRIPGSADKNARADLTHITRELAAHTPGGTMSELQQQNRDQVWALEQLAQTQKALATLNREIEDTNRGVVALYAELEEKAEDLRRSDEMKSRFLSNMSHEFRTPLNSIRALSRMLQEHQDGSLNAEQDKQVGFIAKAASELGALVDDFLDLAKIEAGKVEVKAVEFEVSTLFSTLRGMLKPLLVTDDINLFFEDPVAPITLHTDESKVAQILRNFISNAIKFTERGEVRVSAARDPDSGTIRFCVADTGIGIETADQARIFEEFAQVANRLQGRVKGTGLGLSLCRRLARLLGGDVGVESTPGVGSKFFATIPAYFADTPKTVLIIDDDQACRYLLRKLVSGERTQVIEAATARAGIDSALRIQPALIILDLHLPDGHGEEVLAAVRRNYKLRSVPVAIVTSKALTFDDRQRLSVSANLVLEKRELDTARGRELLALV